MDSGGAAGGAGRTGGGGIKFREGLCLARASPWILARRLRIRLKAAQPLVYVGDEARLAEFAVINDIDAELDLPVDNFFHRLAQAAGMRCRFATFLGSFGRHYFQEVGRPRQTAGMRGGDSVAAALHLP